jgi:glutamate dehydrogenase
MGGSFGRKEASGYGVMITVREALKELGLKTENTVAAIQGFGNVAQNAAQLYLRMGGKILCISCWSQADQTSYTFRKKEGINFSELQAITNPFGEIDKTKALELGYECLPGESWIEQDVNILVPAAIESQITSANVNKINPRVRLIAEGANGPINPDAEAFLDERKILVIPDMLANAGGAICSYFEQVQSNMNYYWRKDEVLGKLDTQITSAYIDVSDFARKNKIRLRDGAYMIAVERVAQACQERGWI